MKFEYVGIFMLKIVKQNDINPCLFKQCFGYENQKSQSYIRVW